MQVRAAGACLALLSAIACAPPGKPGAEPGETAVVTDFPTIYARNCAGCHGANGMQGPGRPINNALYLTWISKDQLRSVIENGRPGTSMPPWSAKQGGPLSDKQIDALVDGIEESWAKPVNLDKASLPLYSDDTQKGDGANGKKLFARSCFMCHGKGAAVGMVTEASYLQLVTDQMLRTAIVVGRMDLSPLKMPDYRTLKLGHALTNQDVDDLVAYLASLRPGEQTKGNEGSGNAPGSPQKQAGEGNKSTGASSLGGPK